MRPLSIKKDCYCSMSNIAVKICGRDLYIDWSILQNISCDMKICVVYVPLAVSLIAHDSK